MLIAPHSSFQNDVVLQRGKLRTRVSSLAQPRGAEDKQERLRAPWQGCLQWVWISAVGYSKTTCWRVSGAEMLCSAKLAWQSYNCLQQDLGHAAVCLGCHLPAIFSDHFLNAAPSYSSLQCHLDSATVTSGSVTMRAVFAVRIWCKQF